ncbi:MAG: FAD-dependent oxidoreductase [Thermomicrobiales bacterium]|nr:FAD-dependent oxidoreductase [Thermomicrobiales bacterium]
MASELTQPPGVTSAAPGEQTSLTRRRLLAAVTGVSVPALLRGPAGAAGERVVVVGAGMAGVAAAATLQQAGLDVVVLEASNRLGGRIWTDTRWGFPLDLGAAWIHGAAGANPIWRLRTQYGLRTMITNWDDVALYDVVGGPVAAAQAATDAARYRSAYRKARRWGNRQPADTSLQSGIDFALRPRPMTPYDQRALDFRLNFEVEQDYGGDAASLSNWWYDQDSWLGGRQDAFIVNGFGELVETLADGLDIRLNSIVSSVTYDASGVRVTTNRGVHVAAFAVVTLPLGVLKANTVAFSPALTRAKRDAIRLLGVGTLNKLVLSFRERFWDDRAVIGYQSANRGEWALWLNLEPVLGKPILVAFNAAAYGAEVEGLTDGQALDAATDVLRTIYGRNVPAPQAAMLTRWNAEPFALGSYSYIPVGASGRHYRVLSAPSGGRLFWAGEATNRKYPQTVAGAYLSGLRAAQQVIAQL